MLAGVYNCYRDSCLVGTTCSTAPVRIDRHIVGKTEIYHVRKVIHIKPACSDIGRYQELRHMVSEFFHCKIPLSLRKVSVQTICIIAIGDEFVGNLLSLLLCAAENYAVDVGTDRSGRTGRANKTGVSVAIIHSREKHKIRLIENKIGKDFEYLKVPTPEHIIEKQLYNLADRLERVEVNESEIGKYLPGVRKKLEWLSEEDLLKRVLSLEFNRLLAYYQNMPDIDLNESDKGKKGRKESEPISCLRKSLHVSKHQALCAHHPYAHRTAYIRATDLYVL